MKILYIDTSTNYLYTGIVYDDKLLSEVKKKFDHDLSKYALYEISKMLEKCNLQPNDIDKIIVVNGPGSFTGIRIGMTIAKLYAFSLKKEIITISSLDAMRVSIKSNNIIVPIIDARRGYVYASVYKNNQVLIPDQYIKLDTLLPKLNDMKEEYIFVTNNKFNLANINSYNPNILTIVETYKNNKAINPHLIEPNYLKLTEAEENLQGISYDN